MLKRYNLPWACTAAIAGLGLLMSVAQASASSLSPKFNQPGNVMIADQFNNRVIEADPSGHIVWSFGVGPSDFSETSIIGCNDQQRVGVFTLMAGTGTPPKVIPGDPGGTVDNRVILVDPFGRIVWQYGQFGVTGSDPNQLSVPVQCTWLPSSHVLITDQANNRIIEVNLAKDIVWSYGGLNNPNSAELLENGHILIANENSNEAIEVTRAGQIVATFSAKGAVFILAFASRLDNGNTLLTDSGNARVLEVDGNDNIVWEYDTGTDPNSIPAPLPTRAVRLKNGDTLISDQFNNRVIRVDALKQIVFSYGTALDGLNPLPGSNNAIGGNVGFDEHSTQKGLFSPYDAKIVGDYTGLATPFDFDD